MNNEFTRRVMAAKKEQKLSLSDLARRTGLSRQHLSNILNGNRPPTWEVVARVGKAVLGADPYVSFVLAGLLPVQLPTENQPRAE